VTKSAAAIFNVNYNRRDIDIPITNNRKFAINNNHWVFRMKTEAVNKIPNDTFKMEKNELHFKRLPCSYGALACPAIDLKRKTYTEFYSYQRNFQYHFLLAP
jgi:hypothetical protein